MKRTPRSAGLLLAALLSATPQAAGADEPRPVIAERFASKLERLYIFPARAHAAAARIRASAAKHAYDVLGDQQFARALTADAGAVLRDKHVLARPINPITHTNWERVGVQPDIVVPFGETFKAAYLAALRREVDITAPQQRSALSEWIAFVEHADAAGLAQQLGVLSVPPQRPLHKGSWR